MSASLFDSRRGALHRQRSRRLNGDQFLYVRAFEDIVDRLAARRLGAQTALLVGPLGPEPLAPLAAAVAQAEALDRIVAAPGTLDLIVLLGQLQAANDLPATAFALRHLLRPGGTIAGCLVGGDSLPRLRSALLDADRSVGRAAQRIHPMLDGASLSSLLQAAGFEHPVIEIDRVAVSYPSLDRLVGDLRALACTSVLASKAPPLGRAQLQVARASFLGGEERATEQFDLLHFTASAPLESVRQAQR